MTVSRPFLLWCSAAWPRHASDLAGVADVHIYVLRLQQPPSTASASYYKIAQNNYVTFGWNLTSL
jgi:hypothetical protein